MDNVKSIDSEFESKNIPLKMPIWKWHFCKIVWTPCIDEQSFELKFNFESSFHSSNDVALGGDWQMFA